ncbi:dihydropteroate synthase [Bartonella sp. DGB1]|uniref:dihydropteroate synthase n=1 Tax=Bartonella sp. DGB1 TaxID=3239807 RepID=UPI0035247AD2
MSYSIDKKKFICKLAHSRELVITEDPIIMAILNLTPDSFSDGGKYQTNEEALHQALLFEQQGAGIVDIGGESTRPGAIPIDYNEEIRRILPVIKILSKKTNVIISVDTYNAQTARFAIDAGAHIINSVKGLTLELAEVVKEKNAAIIVMHNSWHEQDDDIDVMQRVNRFFNKSLEIAQKYHIAKDKIILDPGFGFGKNEAENFSLMKNFTEFKQWGYPLLIGVSRKRFLGALCKSQDFASRDNLTAMASGLLYLQGANIVRVHNVLITMESLLLAKAFKDGNIY